MMENENEPKPGYLGPNMEGHKMPVPPTAWDEIGKELDKEKRRRIIWWFSGCAFLFILGTFGYMEFKDAYTGQPLKESQSIGALPQKQSGGISKMNEIESAPNRRGAPDTPTGQDVENSQPERTNRTENQAENQSGKKDKPNGGLQTEVGPDLNRSIENEFKNPVAVEVRKDEKDRRIKKSTSLQARSSINPVTTRQPAPTIETETKPDKKYNQSEENRTVEKSTPEKTIAPTTGMVTSELKGPSPIGKPAENRTAETKTGLNPKAAIENDNPETSKKPDAGTENESPIRLNPNKVDQIELVPKIARLKVDSMADPKTMQMVKLNSDSLTKLDTLKCIIWKREHFWMLSANAGFLQQNVKLNSPDISRVEVKPSPTSRLSFGRLWQLSRSIWIGVGVSLTGIYQEVSATIFPTTNNPVSFRYGQDSLSFFAESDVQVNRLAYSRTMLAIEYHPRLQWKPIWSPIGIQGSYRIQTFKWYHSSEMHIDGNKYEIGGAFELGAWLPLRKNRQISLDVTRWMDNNTSLPVPVYNVGHDWIISLGYSWKW